MFYVITEKINVKEERYFITVNIHELYLNLWHDPRMRHRYQGTERLVKRHNTKVICYGKNHRSNTLYKKEKSNSFPYPLLTRMLPQ